MSADTGPLGFTEDPFDTRMDGARLLSELFAVANPVNAQPMAKYMRDQFPFLGIPGTVRKPIERPYLAVARKDPHPDWSFVAQCWALPQREFQYVACDYLYAVRAKLTVDDLPRIKSLASSKQWWDSIDALHKTVGAIVAADSSNSGSFGDTDSRSAQDLVIAWGRDSDFWIRRLAIIHQLGRKEATDTAALSEILTSNLGQNEFFINKAIGWALRDFSKTNPEWVAEFVAEHRDGLASLSVREGSKYLP